MPTKSKAKTRRASHHKKLATKGHKSLRDQPELYTQKKLNSTFTLTPFAKSCLNEHAKESGISMSEYLERLIRWTVNAASSDAFAHAQMFISRKPDKTANPGK